MARPDKAAAVAALQEKFTQSNAAVLTEYRGLTVQNLKDLRRSLGDDASYAVAKNTLTRIAAKGAGVEGLDDQLTGPTAVAFITGDVATVAKGLRDFAKDNPLLVIKGGVLDGKVLDAETVKKLADLESREVLLAKLAGALKASQSNAAALFSAPLSQAARLLGALETKASEDPSVIGGAGSPAGGDQEHKTAEESAPEAADAAEATADAADLASTDDASNN
ncbi:MAG: 50S ribosomal protein L10 [Propionibacterium sp.]